MMNVDMWENNGVPIKILRNAVGYDVKCETTNGALYKGKLVGMEDNMNIQLETAVCTMRNGVSTLMDKVLIRGSHVKFLIMPDFLRKKGIFRGRSVGCGAGSSGDGRGRGRAATANQHSQIGWPGHNVTSTGYCAGRTVNQWDGHNYSQASTSGQSSYQYHQSPGSDYSQFYQQAISISPGSSTATYPASDWSPGGQPPGYETHPGVHYPFLPPTQHST